MAMADIRFTDDELRELFAAFALAGMLANPDISASAAREGVTTADFRTDIATAAFGMADAMVRARQAS
jgi:hypothetical protein